LLQPINNARTLSGPGFQDLNARFQDLNLRFQALNARFQDLTLRTWVSGPRKLSILRSFYLFPVTFLCVQWSQTDAHTDRWQTVMADDKAKEEEEESERRTDLCILIHR
jgi:hypothetical protein